MVPLAVLFILAGCGGAAPHQAQRSSRTVGALGFSVQVPLGWRVQRGPVSLVARRGASLVSVTRYTLLKPYAPALFARAARELDRVAGTLAARAGGSLTDRTTTTVAGERVRAYRFTGHGRTGGARSTRIGFVLRGRTEYQLLCDVPAGAGDPDGACALLFASFRL